MGFSINVYINSKLNQLNVVLLKDDQERNKSKEIKSNIMADFTIPLEKNEVTPQLAHRRNSTPKSGCKRKKKDSSLTDYDTELPQVTTRSRWKDMINSSVHKNRIQDEARAPVLLYTSDSDDELPLRVTRSRVNESMNLSIPQTSVTKKNSEVSKHMTSQKNNFEPVSTSSVVRLTKRVQRNRNKKKVRFSFSSNMIHRERKVFPQPVVSLPEITPLLNRFKDERAMSQPQNQDCAAKSTQDVLSESDDLWNESYNSDETVDLDTSDYVNDEPISKVDSEVLASVVSIANSNSFRIEEEKLKRPEKSHDTCNDTRITNGKNEELNNSNINKCGGSQDYSLDVPEEKTQSQESKKDVTSQNYTLSVSTEEKMKISDSSEDDFTVNIPNGVCNSNVKKEQRSNLLWEHDEDDIIEVDVEEIIEVKDDENPVSENEIMVATSKKDVDSHNSCLDTGEVETKSIDKQAKDIADLGEFLFITKQN